MSTAMNLDYEDGLRSARNGGCQDFSEKSCDFIAGYRAGEKENRQIATEEVAGMIDEKLCKVWELISSSAGSYFDLVGFRVSDDFLFNLVFDQMCERDLPVVMAEA